MNNVGHNKKRTIKYSSNLRCNDGSKNQQLELEPTRCTGPIGHDNQVHVVEQLQKGKAFDKAFDIILLFFEDVQEKMSFVQWFEGGGAQIQLHEDKHVLYSRFRWRIM